VKSESTHLAPSTLTEAAPPAHAPSQTLADFVADLLHLLKLIAVQGPQHRSGEFCAQMDQYTAAVVAETDAYRLEILRGNCLKLSEEFFRKWGHYLGEREKELRGVIEILVNAVHALSTDNTAFHQEIAAGHQRLQGYCDLDDLRELKSRLGQEVARLQATVGEKQKRDDAQLSALSQHVTTLQTKLKEAEQKAQLDGLTGVHNRASFDHELRALVAESESFTLALFDIDNFKRINDEHGHQIGDRVIISAALKLRAAIRTSDFIARYGGEEFALIQLGSKIEHALPRVSQVLQEIAAAKYEYTLLGQPRKLAFTVSAGVTEFAPGDTVETIIARADAALYQAKKQGKNRAIAVRKD
jgi:diguanylate cyclase